MDQVYFDVKDKGHFWNINQINKEELNSVLLYNRRPKYKLTMKQKKEKPGRFWGFGWLWSGSSEWLIQRVYNF